RTHDSSDTSPPPTTTTCRRAFTVCALETIVSQEAPTEMPPPTAAANGKGHEIGLRSVGHLQNCSGKIKDLYRGIAKGSSMPQSRCYLRNSREEVVNLFRLSLVTSFSLGGEDYGDGGRKGRSKECLAWAENN
ncbi:deleted in malignant brain tumors 1 protein, partial [Striga asiatica]